MTTPKQSPTPTKKEKTGIPFSETIKELLVGKKIHKLEWKEKNIFGQLLDGKLVIHLKDGMHQWVLSDGDLSGTDYIIL